MSNSPDLGATLTTMPFSMHLANQNSTQDLPASAKCRLPLYVKSKPNKLSLATLLYKANAIAKGTVLLK